MHHLFSLVIVRSEKILRSRCAHGFTSEERIWLINMKTPELLAEAVRRYRAGDKESFNEIYEASYRYLYICIANVVRDEEATMDMLQETYLEISKSIGQLRQDEDFLSWAAVIANRKCFSYLKKNREILLEQRENEGEEFFETIPDDELFIPESIFQDREKRKLIREIIDGLSDMQRLCVICYYYNEMTQEQIAEELQIPLNTVKSHLSRAKQKIKDEIIEMDEKKGTRLYSIAPALLLFFTKEAEDCQVPPMSEDLKEAVTGEESPNSPDGQAQDRETGRSVVQKFLKAGIGVKAGAAAAVVVVLVGVIAAVQIFNRESTDAVNNEEQNVQEIGGETEETVETAQETGQEVEETAEETQEEPGTESADFTELAISGKYDSYGSAKDGMVVVEKDGLYGLVTFDDQVIVPIEYSDCLFRINDDGQTVFGDDGGYKVFDREGNVLFETEMWIKAVSDGVVLMVESNREDQSYTYRYETLDGTVVNEPEYPGYIGQMGAVGFNEGYAFADNGDGDIRIQKDGSWQSMKELRAPYDLSQKVHMVKDEEAKAETTGKSNSGFQVEANGTSGLMDIMAYPLGVCHNGYFVSGGMQFEDTNGDYYILNPEGTEQYRFRIRELIDHLGYSFYESNASWKIDSYEVNGSLCYSYGTLMSIKLTLDEEEKTYLIDLSKLEWRDYSGSEAYKDLSFDEVSVFGVRRMIIPDGALLAVSDSLDISDNKYWLVGENGKWGYVDHDGKKQEMFDDASEFVNGKAMVIKDGKAYYIDENLKCSEEGMEADAVYTYGEMFIVVKGNRLICLSAGE